MAWFRAHLGNEGRDVADFQSLFVMAFDSSSGLRRDRQRLVMAMFIAHSTDEGGRYCYFTPDTEQLAPHFLRIVRAAACEPPTEAISFQTGDEIAGCAFQQGNLWRAI